MTAPYFPVTEPVLDGTDRAHLLDAFDSGWISARGPYLAPFEDDFARFVGADHALATCTGTAALHLALRALGTGPGDEVVVPTFAHVATANAVRYCGATPVLVDCEPDTWNVAPAAVLAAITPRTVGIIAVHVYGAPCDMDKLLHLAGQYALWTVEDAAAAHGATVGDRLVGSLGTLAAFSLDGNRIITTGAGGMVTTSDPELARLVSLHRGQGHDPDGTHAFPVVGFDYEMTNLSAALGVAQLAKVDRLVAAHRRVAGWYREALDGCDELAWQTELAGTRTASWLTSVRYRPAEDRSSLRDQLMAQLRADGIETRPFFRPMHVLAKYAGPGAFPCADAVSRSGFNLPSSPLLTHGDVLHIAARVRQHVEAANVFSGARLVPRRQLPQPELATT